MIKLDIGCGRDKQPGHIGIDPYVNADIQALMWDLPFKANSVSFIYSSHALEHIEKQLIVPVLREWGRVLIDSAGLIELRVPDLRWCCQQWLEHGTNDWWLDIIFGNQEHPGEFHKTGFTKEIMLEYIEEADLILIDSDVTWSHCQPTLIFRMAKSNDPSRWNDCL